METERSKYNVDKNVKIREFNGIIFDSEVEMRFYCEVVLPRIESREIMRCELQKKYILQPAFTHCNKKIKPIEYVADFYIVSKEGKETVIDVKGCPDAKAQIKRKMFWYIYPNIDYIWVGFSKPDNGWALYETIIKGRKLRKKLKAKLKEEKE